MTTEAERIPVEERYLRAVGRATYNFAYLEWGIVWLAETLQVGFLNEVRKLTAGQIANRFSQAVGTLADRTPEKEALTLLASSFTALVEDLNRLVHGKPVTATGGEQRLLYDGKHGHKDWTIELIEDFAAKTAIASIEAGQLLHGGRLEKYQKNRALS